MNLKGTLTARPARRFRLFLGLHLLLVMVSLLLVTWWGTLLFRQAIRIAELEKRLGIESTSSPLDGTATQRMIFAESVSFFILLLVLAGALLWMYWRDEQRRRGLEAFFASITHELKTPLTSIRLQAESIADAISGTDSQKRLVGRLLEDTNRLEAQVERTLELARLEGGGTLYPTEIDVDAWLSQTLPRWKEAGSRLAIKSDLSAAGATIIADPHAMEVVIRNVFENASRHGGKSPIEVDVSTRAGSDHVAIVIQDNGSGYPGDTSKLGTLFEKGPASKGSGIGLYLIRSLMSQMGGRATFSSNLGFETLLIFKKGSDNP